MLITGSYSISCAPNYFFFFPLTGISEFVGTNEWGLNSLTFCSVTKWMNEQIQLRNWVSVYGREKQITESEPKYQARAKFKWKRNFLAIEWRKPSNKYRMTVVTSLRTTRHTHTDINSYTKSVLMGFLESCSFMLSSYFYMLIWSNVYFWFPW